MLIVQRATAINNYHNNVKPNLIDSQNKRVMDCIKYGEDYSISELIEIEHAKHPKLRQIDKSAMSRIVNCLRKEGKLVTGADRPCSITRITITPSKLPDVQLELV